MPFPQKQPYKSAGVGAVWCSVCQPTDSRLEKGRTALTAELLVVEVRSLCPCSAIDWDKFLAVQSQVWEFSVGIGHRTSPAMLTTSILTWLCSIWSIGAEVWTWPAMAADDFKARCIKWDPKISPWLWAARAFLYGLKHSGMRDDFLCGRGSPWLRASSAAF